jgi:hypothetical protein
LSCKFDPDSVTSTKNDDDNDDEEAENADSEDDDDEADTSQPTSSKPSSGKQHEALKMDPFTPQSPSDQTGKLADLAVYIKSCMYRIVF